MIAAAAAASPAAVPMEWPRRGTKRRRGKSGGVDRAVRCAVVSAGAWRVIGLIDVLGLALDILALTALTTLRPPRSAAGDLPVWLTPFLSFAGFAPFEWPPWD